MSRKNYLGFTIVLLAVLALLPGCASNRAIATIDPTTDLSSLKVFYVKKYSEDTRDTNVIIEDKLVGMGFQVSQAEADVDAIVTYMKWTPSLTQ
jgi:hypothetical protein